MGLEFAGASSVLSQSCDVSWLAIQNAWAIDQGGVPTTEASMAKIFVSELSARFADVALEILGPLGQLGPDDPDAPVDGRIQWLYRVAPMLRFGGGTNEVQRIIIAQRGLGLPR